MIADTLNYKSFYMLPVLEVNDSQIFCFSVSFAGLGFLSWYLAGKIKVFDQRGHVAKLCIIFLPLLGAALVAVSRVDDYRHHWQDVCTGGVLGRSDMVIY